MLYVVVVQSLSHVQLFTTPWTTACQASLSFSISQRLLKFMSIELVMPSNHLILCQSFSSWFKSFQTSGSNPMCWLNASHGQSTGPQLQHQSFQWIFRVDFIYIDWFDLFGVQQALKSLFQHLLEDTENWLLYVYLYVSACYATKIFPSSINLFTLYLTSNIIFIVQQPSPT